VTGWEGAYGFTVLVAEQAAHERFIAEVEARRVPGTPFVKSF